MKVCADCEGNERQVIPGLSAGISVDVLPGALSDPLQPPGITRRVPRIPSASWTHYSMREAVESGHGPFLTERDHDDAGWISA
jgi:hypothetical protein